VLFCGHAAQCHQLWPVFSPGFRLSLALGRVEFFFFPGGCGFPTFPLARLGPVRAILTGLPLTEATSSCLGTFPVSDLSLCVCVPREVRFGAVQPGPGLGLAESYLGLS